jgi:hypothetical protein
MHELAPFCIACNLCAYTKKEQELILTTEYVRLRPGDRGLGPTRALLSGGKEGNKNGRGQPEEEGQVGEGS